MTVDAVATADLSHPGALELLRRQLLARMAYTGPDGFPRVIPIGFHWTGERVVVYTSPIAPKIPALSARPNVALTIDSDDGPATRSLFVRGMASIEIADDVLGEYLVAATKAMDGEQARQFQTEARSVHKQMARITIEPHWARFYDFAADRVPDFIRQLVNENSSGLQAINPRPLAE
jgi:nitroimidazol reductase NimA-like FMN-containing flavoprotein (pyridoxamine 5'-phosphate oxidase superfamily)